MRALAASLSLLALAGACDAPDGEAGKSSAGVPVTDPNTFRADAAADRSYAGEWATERNQCGDEKKLWTIESHRMAIAPAMRFCAFDKIYVSEGSEGAAETWSASAKCLAEGKESHDFLFFRVKESQHEMRFTMNDTDSVDLVRCPTRT